MLTGWLLEGRSTEDRNKVLAALNGERQEAEGVNDAALAEAYAEDGAPDLAIQMRQEMRNEPDPQRKAAIRVKYMQLAREATEKLKAETEAAAEDE